MNVKTRPAYAPEFTQQIIEWYASGQSPSELARECGCSEASTHAWMKKAGTLKSLPDAGKAVKIVHRQAHRLQVAMALSADERAELLRLRKDNKRSQVERNVLANSLAYMRGLVCRDERARCHAIFTLMRAANQADAQGRSYPVRTLAKVLDVSASGYYDWRDHEPSARAVNNELLGDQIEQIHEESKAIYGEPKIRAELRDASVPEHDAQFARASSTGL